MVTIRPWCDVDKLSFLQHVDQVPFALAYYARFPGTQFKCHVRIRVAHDTDPSRHYVENLVAIGVNLAPMGRVIDNSHDSYGHTIDSHRRAGSTFSGRHGEVSVNVEQIARSVYGDNFIQRVNLLSVLACALVA